MRAFKLLLLLLFINQYNSFAQFALGDATTEKEYSKILKGANRATRDFTDMPASSSLRKYAPTPGNQGQYGTCVAWSASYAARTISYSVQKNITNSETINKYAFSPGYIYYKIKNPADTNCSKGANITQAMQVMRVTGDVLKSEGVFDCAASVPDNIEQQKAKSFKIKDFLSLSDYNSITKNDILKIKKSITEKKPVVFSLKCFASFYKTSSAGLWTPVENDIFRGNHAMCIIGYNDNIAGGAFEVMNSWGTGWGDKGYFWLTYQQMIGYGNYAVEMMDFEGEKEKPQLSGNMEFVKLDGTPMPVKRTMINTRSFTVEDDANADFSLYKLTETFTGGTQFKLKFATNSPAYVYIFAEDDKGIISRFFPYNPTVSAAINSSNATVYLPAENKHARLSTVAGKENICVLYSKNELDFESLLTFINNTKTSIYQAVKDKYGAKLMDLKQVKFDDDKINFKAPVNESSVLCFFIELKHN